MKQLNKVKSGSGPLTLFLFSFVVAETSYSCFLLIHVNGPLVCLKMGENTDFHNTL
jgi:hypothetical protein